MSHRRHSLALRASGETGMARYGDFRSWHIYFMSMSPLFNRRRALEIYRLGSDRRLAVIEGKYGASE